MLITQPTNPNKHRTITPKTVQETLELLFIIYLSFIINNLHMNFSDPGYLSYWKKTTLRKVCHKKYQKSIQLTWQTILSFIWVSRLLREQYITYISTDVCCNYSFCLKTWNVKKIDELSWVVKNIIYFSCMTFIPDCTFLLNHAVCACMMCIVY